MVFQLNRVIKLPQNLKIAKKNPAKLKCSKNIMTRKFYVIKLSLRRFENYSGRFLPGKRRKTEQERI